METGARSPCLRALFPLAAFSKDTRTFAKPQVRLPGSIRVHLWRKKGLRLEVSEHLTPNP